MANLFENKDRRVIPNWRSLKATIQLGELDSIDTDKVPAGVIALSIEEYIQGWKENRSTAHAGDLLSAGFVNNASENINVIEAAMYISNNSKSATLSQVSLAEMLLNKNKGIQADDIEVNLFDDFAAFFTDLSKIYVKISLCKKKLIRFPYNPMLYVDLSRFYSILGQVPQAENAMKCALQLAPENRYVIRSAARLFTHLGQFDYAHEIVRRKKSTGFDPWLVATEISLATIKEKSSRFMKVGMEMVESKSFSPHSISELASAIGTVELINGSRKKSKRFFNSSLISPNDNSLAQAEWANNSITLFDNLDPTKFGVQNNYEALALQAFYGGKWSDALKWIQEWFFDMPYSKRPLMIGHHIAGSLLNKHDMAVEFCKIALISNPNDALIINNIAYSLALAGKTNEASRYLLQVEKAPNIQKTTEICLTATKGLILYRTDNIEPGRELYLKAIQEAKDTGNSYLNWIAILNYAREEILVKADNIEYIMDNVSKIPDDERQKDIKKMKSEVIELYAKMKREI